MKNIILVAGGVLINPQGEVLLAKRPPGKVMAGYWEFPGGKVEPNETLERALTREIKEELDADITAYPRVELGELEYSYPHGRVLLKLVIIFNFQAIIKNAEGQELLWVNPLNWVEISPLLPTTSLIFERLNQFLSGELCSNIISS